MNCNEINIRDPFIFFENGTYYMYGSRAKNFAVKSGGFDVYTSSDLVEWSRPHECFNSIEHNMNQGANWAPELHKYNDHYVTDGPFLYRTKSGELLMIWSSFIENKYAELLVHFESGELGTNITHLPPIIDNDGGHGMIFKQGENLEFVFHSPNTSGEEKPCFIELEDKGDFIAVK